MALSWKRVGLDQIQKKFYDEGDETLEQVAREVVDPPLLEVLKAGMDEAQPSLLEGVPASSSGLARDDV